MNYEDFSADDYPIAAIPDTAMWSENYAYSCNAADAGVSMIALFGRWWADPTVWREVVSIGLPGDRFLCIKNYGRAATDKVASASLLRHEVVEPGRTTRLVYDGPAFEHSRTELVRHGFVPAAARRCRMDLTFEGCTPVWNMSGHAGKSANLAGQLHTEQVGLGKGHVEFGGERFDIAGAFMNRDHSRGVRIVNKYKRHCWAQGYFAATDTSFNIYVIELHGVDGWAMANASVTRDGRRFPATLKEIDLIRGSADACQPYAFLIESELGAQRIEVAQTQISTPLSIVSPFEFHHGAVPTLPAGTIYEDAVRWRCGDQIGSGWSERGFALDPLYLHEED